MFSPSTDLHFVHAMVSGDLVGGDNEVLLLDSQGLVTKGRVMTHLALGVEAVEVSRKGREGGRERQREGWFREREDRRKRKED